MFDVPDTAHTRETTMTTETQTIDIGPKTWSDHLSMLLLLVTDGNAEGRAYGRAELARMARCADAYVASKAVPA
jgi:hypothetical protein